MNRTAMPPKIAPSPRTTRKGNTSSAKNGRLKTSYPEGKSHSAPDRGTGRSKVSKHVDAKVAARNNALNAMGGVKVDVFCRIRPPLAREDPKTINVEAVKDAETSEEQVVVTDPQGRTAAHTYDKVYGPECTQEKIYEDAVAPIVDQVSRGMSCAVFAYGQTGSGKTHTMRGTSLSGGDDDGIIQRSVSNLFRRLNEQDYSDIKVSVSFLEVYNEDLEDMLNPKNNKKLMLVDHDSRGCVCANLTEKKVENVSDVLSMLKEADKHTRISETKMNKFSNRAHRIFTIVANFKRYDTDVTSTLTFIDLAGSEDISKSGATGLTAREAAHINKSLLTLGRVINALACNEKHIPYRDSKLTRLLSEALGGVCKTSFIACISPCSTSATETTSTLRYAERAMEALNISQLPRWKQDEIMIDGLTRRVQQLLDQLESQEKCHKEEVDELRNKNSALVEEKKALEISNFRLNRKIEKLVARKKQLKNGLATVTSQRDLLHTQKEHLREELLYTRKERDGYLSDRAELSVVLQGVRLMRQRLLEAHQSTETSLTGDAAMLKGVVEGCIGDIGDLHSEVARKKSISSHNEKIADEYKDRMSHKIRDIVQLVDDFKSSQASSHSGVQDALLALKNQNQIDTNGNRQKLSSLSQQASELLSQISTFCVETENAIASKITSQETTVQKFGASLSAVVDKFKAATSTNLEHLRTEAAGAEAKVAEWAEAVATKLAERETSVNDFNALLNASLANLETSLQSATSAHLESLTNHKDALNVHLESERATMAKESEELLDTITSYVNRMVNDFTNQSVRRTELAVTALTTETDTMSTQARDMLSDQLALQRTLADRGTDWQTKSIAAITDGKEASSALRATTDLRLAAIVKQSQNADAELVTGTTTAITASKAFTDNITAEMSDTTMYSKQRTAEASSKMQAGNSSLSVSSELIRAEELKQHQALCSSQESIKASLKSTLDEVKTQMGHTHDDLFDHEADSVKFVVQDIVRDTQPSPPKKGYTYPHEFTATDPYAQILADVPDDWNREVRIIDGKADQGKGTDYEGNLGNDDVSGLMQSTADQPLLPEKAAIIDDAAAMSDPEDYEVTEYPPEYAPISAEPEAENVVDDVDDDEIEVLED